ncbi:hypothetical protein CPB86DRAFT_743307 [Serendipita vermifera]|nr:hypothetical protein CPB86DRAFT_743307 [Serendipita vermifera]
MWKQMVVFAPVIVGPFGAVFTRRIVQMWYTRIGNAEEETLKKLLLEQRSKVEEIKKKTDFYSTQKLLERYDRQENAMAATPARKPHPNAANPNAPHSGPNAPPGANMVTPVRPGVPGVPGQNGMTPMPPGYMSAFSPQPIQPTPRRWYDRLADAVLGDEDGAASGAHSKYALICKRCFTHNGLVKESDFATTKFVCMKCGFLNSPDSKGDLSPSGTPELASSLRGQTASPSSPSPAVANNLDSTPSAPAKKQVAEDEGVFQKSGPKPIQRRQTRNSRKSMANTDMETD